MSDHELKGLVRVMSTDEIREKVELIDKLFGHVDQVGWFNRHGHGPHIANVCVRANVHPSLHYPHQRIMFGQYGMEPAEMDFGGVLMSVSQTILLIKMLNVAVQECLRANPQLLLAPTEIDDLDPEATS